MPRRSGTSRVVGISPHAEIGLWLGDQGEVDGLGVDQTVLEHKRLHAVGDAASGGGGSPLKEEDVVREGGLDVPLRVGKRLERAGKEGADALPTARDRIRGDDAGCLSIILPHGIQVAGHEGLPVMREDLLWGAPREISCRLRHGATAFLTCADEAVLLRSLAWSGWVWRSSCAWPRSDVTGIPVSAGQSVTD